MAEDISFMESRLYVYEDKLNKDKCELKQTKALSDVAVNAPLHA